VLAALVVVDTETGGLSPSNASITEIAAQVIEVYPGDLQLAETFETKCKPDRPVSPKAAEVNGYTPEAWADAPELPEALAEFTAWLDEVCKRVAPHNPMWTGCNPLFDLKFFKSDAERHGVTLPEGLSYRMIDVQSLCLPLLLKGEIEGLGLRHLRAWAGCEGEQTHTAMGDVNDTCQVIGAFLL